MPSYDVFIALKRKINVDAEDIGDAADVVRGMREKEIIDMSDSLFSMEIEHVKETG